MVANTAAWIAAVRARESERADRLFADPFAAALAGPEGVAMMRRSEAATGRENPVIPVRVRWFDDAIRAAVADGIGQVVLLGAGLDTRAYRLDLPAGLHWFEVDRRDVLRSKRTALAAHLPRCRVTTVPTDLEGAGVGAELVGAGLDRDRPVLWVAEGLFFYLSATSTVELLTTAATTGAPGGRFLADVTGSSGLDSPAMRPYLDWCHRTGAPPPTGHDDPAALFATGGWTVEALCTPGAPEANYGRLHLQPPGPVPGRVHFVRAGLSH